MQDAIFLFLVSLMLLGPTSVCVAADAGQRAGNGDVKAAETQDSASVPGNGAVRRDDTELPAGPAEIIKSIEFEGNRKFKDHVLRERLGFDLGERLDPFLAEGGRQTIAEVYRKIGYPSVTVSLDRERLKEGHLLYRIDEGTRVQIGSIDFVGNEAFRSKTLKQVIKTKEKKWLLWPNYYTEEAIEEDLERLREFYYGQGYLDYKITARTERAADGEKIDVAFVIAEGPVYRVVDIILSGNTRFTNEQLRERIELREGDVYRRARAERGAREMAQLYRERGYVDATVRQNPRFTPKTDEPVVALEYRITEGRQFRIGRIDVTGNEQTKDKVVRRVLDEYGFTPGELYNAKIAPKEGNGLLEKYVQRAGTAQSAAIRPVTPPQGDPNQKDVRVDIEEGMTGMVRPGVGFSSDSGVIGQLIYQQRNFDISDWPGSFDEWLHPWRAFRGAGQILNVSLEPGTRYSQYYVNFIDPYWGDMPVTFDASGRLWERFRESYDEERLKGSFGFEQRLESNWRRSIGFRAENVGVENLDFDAPQEIRDVEGYTQLLGVRFGLGAMEVDDRYDPSEGHSINAFYEQVTGDDTFGILEGSFVHYVPLYEDVLGRKTVLAFKVLAGTMVGDAPPFEKFYAGGTGRYALRGFEYRGVSTRGLQTNVPNPERKDPIGSDWVFLAGTELTVPLVGENFNALFFIDSGTVDTGSYRLSIGAGIEIKVPQIFGNIPMRFELATPLLRDDEDETQVFSFSGGGLFY